MGDNLSVSAAPSQLPTPFVPSGHFPLIRGIGPWKGSQGVRTAGNAQKWVTASQSAAYFLRPYWSASWRKRGRLRSSMVLGTQ